MHSPRRARRLWSVSWCNRPDEERTAPCRPEIVDAARCLGGFSSVSRGRSARCNWRNQAFTPTTPVGAGAKCDPWVNECNRDLTPVDRGLTRPFARGTSAVLDSGGSEPPSHEEILFESCICWLGLDCRSVFYAVARLGRHVEAERIEEQRSGAKCCNLDLAHRRVPL